MYYTNGERLLSNRGNEFYVGILPSTASFADGIRLIYTTDSPNDITVTTATERFTQTNSINVNTSSVKTWKTIANSIIANQLPIHIHSSEGNKFIVVASLLLSRSMTASYLAIPNHKLLCKEYEYIVLSANTENTQRLAGIFIIGTSNDTHVNISLSFEPNEDYASDFILQYMETKYFEAPINTAVTGTKIVSDKPLTVISGHEAGSVPSDGTLEPMAQQIPPTQFWGERFLISALKRHPFGQIVKVLTSVDYTLITYNCHQFSNQTILPNASKVHQFYVPANIYCYIKANNSILVGQFPYSPQGNTDGDTTMILIASVDQYSNSFTFWTTGESISIMIPANVFNANESVLHNGILVKCEQWSVIYDIDNSTIVGYGCGLEVTEGHHTVSHVDSNGRLFIIVYWFGIGKAYGYPAGLTFSSIKGTHTAYID